jgi:PilZ domain
MATLRHLNQHAPQTPVIVLCNSRDRDTAIKAVRKGAHDFFCYDDPDISNLRRAVDGVLKNGDGGKDEQSGADRRTNARFPCRLAVSYQALEQPFFSGTATSETLNISSKGLLFPTQEALQPGQLLQVSVDWPARLENQVPLKLVAEGRIVRNLNGLAAMRIDKYEFRTRRAKVPVPAAGSAAAQKPENPKSSRPAETAPGISSQPGTAAGNKANDAHTRREV